ncbi:MAG TPA: hypothetical protein DIU14_09905 [Actinobacteria bacterium]|nr:hypothetical protein [Actinomycetota bacterium]
MTGKRRVATWIGAAFVALMVAAGCGGDNGVIDVPTTLPSNLPSGLPTSLPSGLPTTLPSGFPTSLPSGFPTSLPSGITSQFTKGSAELHITGATNTTLNLSLTEGVFVGAAGGAGEAVWGDANAHELAVAGHELAGSQKTNGSSLSVSMGVNGFYVSESGECTVNFTKAGSDGLAGTLSCSNVQGSGGAINVSGSFSATP